MTPKELRNKIVSKLWSYGKLPKNIQTLMTDNEVDFMLEVINTYVAEQLTIHSVSQQREILIAFYEYIEKNVVIGQNLPETDIDDFLKANNYM